MERETFYKDQYDRTLETKNEINSSLSIQAGILTALIAGLFFITCNFSFSNNILLSVIFSIICIICIYTLSKSTHYLIIAFSDFHREFSYAYLSRADVLDKYFQNLLDFYSAQPAMIQQNAIEIAEKEFAAYITNETITNAALNQKANDYKTFHRFYCNEYITYSLIYLSLLLMPYAIDFGIAKTHQKIKIENSIQTNHNINKILN